MLSRCLGLVLAFQADAADSKILATTSRQREKPALNAIWIGAEMT
jgi:hypothetical protein